MGGCVDVLNGSPASSETWAEVLANGQFSGLNAATAGGNNPTISAGDTLVLNKNGAFLDIGDMVWQDGGTARWTNRHDADEDLSWRRHDGAGFFQDVPLLLDVSAGDVLVANRLAVAGGAFASASVSRDDLVIGDGIEANIGMTFHVPTGGTVGIEIAEAADNIEMGIEFDLSDDEIDFRVADSIRMTLTSTALVSNVGAGIIDIGSATEPFSNVFHQSQNVGTQTTGAGGVTLDATDYLLTVTGGGGVTLPASGAAVEGRVYAVDNQQLAASTTVTPNGGDTINGAASVTIGSSAVAFFVLEGTRWSSWEAPHTT